jgi:hypothetical protein
MNACFQGIDLVESRFVTFMYDDDVLSPFIGQMYEPVVSGDSDFVVGFGAETPAHEVRNFHPVGVMRHYKPKFVLEQYFGARDMPFTALPVSPICCLTKKEHILEWRSEVVAFASRTPLRQYLMLERNVGPDLIIYLSGLLISNKDVTVCFTTVAQFSTHPDSMSIRYNALDLSVGYWLARLFVIDKLIARRELELAVRCAGHHIGVGILLAARSAANRKGTLLRGVLAELASLIRSLAAVGQLPRALAYTVRLATRRATRGSALTTPE